MASSTPIFWRGRASPARRNAKKRAFYERVADVVIPNQARLQQAARGAGIEIIFTVIESLTQDGRDRSLDHKISDLHFPKGSWDAKVIDAVGPRGDEIIIPKTASGIFNATNIEYVLRNLGIEYPGDLRRGDGPMRRIRPSATQRTVDSSSRR